MDGFFSGLSMVSHRLVEHSLEISVLIALIFLFKRVASRRLPPLWHYSLWLILLIRMLIPLEYENRFCLFNFIPSISTPVIFESVDPLPSTFLMTVPGEEGQGGGRSSMWLDFYENYIPFLWFGGACVFALYVVIRCLVFSWAIKEAPSVTDGTVLTVLSETKSRMKIRRRVPVLLTDRVSCPSLFGYFRPRLLLPEGVMKDISDRELTYAFMHELGHLKRHDIGLGWVIAFLQAFYWFNPLAWLAFHRMRLDQELACDALVLERMKEEGGTSDYAKAIVGFLERFCRNKQLPSLAGILESKVQMVGRITGIVGYKRLSGKKRFGAVALFFVTMTFLFMFTGSLQRNGSSSTVVQVSGNNAHDRLPEEVGGGPPDSKNFQRGATFYPAYNPTVNNKGIASLLETTVMETPSASVKRALERSNEVTAFRGEEHDVSGMIVGFGNSESSSRKTDGAIPLPQKDTSRYFPESTPIAMETPPALAPDSHPEDNTDSWGVLKPEENQATAFSLDNGRTPGFTPRTMASTAPVQEIVSGQVCHEQLKSSAPVVAVDTAGRASEGDSGAGEVLQEAEVDGKNGQKVYLPSEVDMLPRVARTYPPRYPYAAKRDNISGSITVQFVVSREGYAVSSKVVASEPEGVFDYAVLEAMRAYRFEPGIKNGEAVDVLVNLPIKFNLS